MNREKAWTLILFILGGALALLTPGVIIAYIMALVTLGDASEFSLNLFLLFGIVSISYFITYLVCLITYLIKKNKKLMLAIIPFIHLGVAIILFIIWSFTV